MEILAERTIDCIYSLLQTRLQICETTAELSADFKL